MLIKTFLSTITINYSSGDRLMADKAGLFCEKCCTLDAQLTLEKRKMSELSNLDTQC